MNRPIRTFFVLATVALLGFAFGPPAAQAVDDARLRAADSDTANWLTYGHGYMNQRYTEADQINRENVSRLVPKWIYQTGMQGSFQTNPLIADGVMYFTTPMNHVVALDAESGDEIWRYRHQLTTEDLCCVPLNRGLALGYGLIYMIAIDARLVALDQKTGEIRWDTTVADPGAGKKETMDALVQSDPLKKWELIGWTGFTGNMAPLLYDGLIIVGVSGTGYGIHVTSGTSEDPLAVIGVSGAKHGLRAFLTAYDARTGRLKWRWYATPEEGWEGDFVTHTASGDPLPRDIAAEKAAVAQYPDAWQRGGGAVWTHPALDTELGLLYVGTGNPSPHMDDADRPGDNLYTVSLVALDAHTGKMKWYQQQVPHDLWGQDVASPPLLFETEFNGKPVKAISQASKSGWLYVHDRVTGELLMRSEPFVPQKDVFTRPNREGVLRSPGELGGANWPPTAYSPQTGWIYVGAVHYPMKYILRDVPSERSELGDTYTAATGEPGITPKGRLSAIDPVSGKIQWQVKTETPMVGGVVTTAGGLLFTGESSGYFTARDVTDGKLLWRFQTGAGVNAPPIVYQVNGKQFVAVAAGGNRLFRTPPGNAVIAFGLPD